MSFIKKLNAVVEELKANPEIFVAHYQVLPPDVAAIKAVEAELGYALDSSITDFYKECGGVQLLWVHESNDRFESLQEKKPTKKPLEDWFIKGEYIDFFPEGAIWIPSIKTVFSTDWSENGMEFDKNSFDATISKNYEKFKIQVFDWFSSFNDLAFLVNGTSNPPLVLGDDNQATYTESHIIDFKSYLELLIKSKGSKEIRVDFLNKNSNDSIDGFVKQEDIENLEAVF